MQGFFVKAKGKSANSSEPVSLELEYDVNMMIPGTFLGDDAIPVRSRASEGWSTISIEAISGGKISSTADIVVGEGYSSGYEENEDMETIDNSDLEIPATVYTVGDRALTINATPEVSNTEIGILSEPDENVTLRFSGDDLSGLMLYDRELDRYTDLYDGMEYEVKAPVSTRLFLTRGQAGVEVRDSGISWSDSGGCLTVMSGNSGARLAVRLYNMSGSTVASESSQGDSLTLTVAPGIYLLEANDGIERVCRQILVR